MLRCELPISRESVGSDPEGVKLVAIDMTPAQQRVVWACWLGRLSVSRGIRTRATAKLGSPCIRRSCRRCPGRRRELVYLWALSGVEVVFHRRDIAFACISVREVSTQAQNLQRGQLARCSSQLARHRKSKLAWLQGTVMQGSLMVSRQITQGFATLASSSWTTSRRVRCRTSCCTPPSSDIDWTRHEGRGAQ